MPSLPVHTSSSNVQPWKSEPFNMEMQFDASLAVPKMAPPWPLLTLTNLQPPPALSKCSFKALLKSLSVGLSSRPPIHTFLSLGVRAIMLLLPQPLPLPPLPLPLPSKFKTQLKSLPQPPPLLPLLPQSFLTAAPALALPAALITAIAV